MKNSTLSVGVSVFFFLFVTAWLLHARSLPFSAPVTRFGGPATFPFLVLLIMVVGFGWVVASEYRKMRQGDDEQATDPASCKRVMALFAVAAAYVLIIDFAGYVPATMLLLLASLLLFGVRDKRVLVAVPVLFPAVLWFLFQRLLEVQLP
jgi:hypothetical protein